MQIIVLSMHRSGSSAVARLINMMGAYFGPEGMSIPTNEENPKGFWERIDVRILNDLLLHSVGCDWHDVVDFDITKLDDEVLRAFQSSARQIIHDIDANRPWMLKEPRFCITFPCWKPNLDCPIAVLVYRHPVEVAESLNRRNAMSLDLGLALWEKYVLESLDVTQGTPRLLVHHRDLIDDCCATAKVLHRQLIELGVDRLRLPKDPEIEAFIDKNLYRAKAVDGLGEGRPNSVQARLFEGLKTGEALTWRESPSLSEGAGCILEAHRRDQGRQPTADERSDWQSTYLDLGATRHAAMILEGFEKTKSLLQQRMDPLKRAADWLARYRATRTPQSIENDTDPLEMEEATKQSKKAKGFETDPEMPRDDPAQIGKDGTLLGNGLAEEREIHSRDQTLIEDLEANAEDLRRQLTDSRDRCQQLKSELASIKESKMWHLAAAFDRLRSRFNQVIPTREIARPGKRPNGSVRRQGSNRSVCRKIKISILSWDMGHNPLGRAFSLADALRHDFLVEIFGANFPRFGSKIWRPLRDEKRIKLRPFRGTDFPSHLSVMKRMADEIDGDILYVVKPRLPSLGLGIMAKARRNRPLILDVDDDELSFFHNRQPLALCDVDKHRHDREFLEPYGEIWTRVAQTLTKHVDAVTVSNETLKEKFGGTIVPHLRDQREFDPDLFDRKTVRRRFGVSDDDFVILFLGTPRMHKGIRKICQAVTHLNDPHVKLCVIGSPADRQTHKLLSSVHSSRAKVLDNIPFRDLPLHLALGNMVCLFQDPSSPISRCQIPAKLTDALAMKIPIVASEVPPLIPLAGQGLIKIAEADQLPEIIAGARQNPNDLHQMAERGRDYFLRHMSQSAFRPVLKHLMNTCINRNPQEPKAFEELINTLDNVFGRSGSADDEGKSKSTSAVKLRSNRYWSPKYELVFFWKQNDSGVYGRRQDMLLKYLAQHPQVAKIVHFDAPLGFRAPVSPLIQSKAKVDQTRLVMWQTLKRKLGFSHDRKTKRYTYIHRGRGGQSVFRWISSMFFPSPSEYARYVRRKIVKNQIGKNRVIAWFCPKNMDFAHLKQALRPDLIVCDVIDDHTKWSCTPEHRDELMENYREILSSSDIVLANCKPVRDRMQAFHRPIHLVRNACELFDQADDWPVPKSLMKLKRPIIGYAGNLDPARLDIDLLKFAATSRPAWSFVMIGSAHQAREILELDECDNVHFLGAKPYEKALRFIRHFDAAMIPHLDNPLTQSMNPLKLYVYLSLGVPTVTTRIHNLDELEPFVTVASDKASFIEAVEHAIGSTPAKNKALTRVLEQNSWPERVRQIMELINDMSLEKSMMRSTVGIPADDHRPSDEGPVLDEVGGRRQGLFKSNATGDLAAVAPPAPKQRTDRKNDEAYHGRCSICGVAALFEKKHPSFREGYRCPNCRASLRYRCQASALINVYAEEGAACLADLVCEPRFSALAVYEPGVSGPFRRYLSRLPNYQQSFFRPKKKTGANYRGLRNENLEALTFHDRSFDLVISSDILEHVRHPGSAFGDIWRVLRPGGFHIFTVPVHLPMPEKTVPRVDVSGKRDSFLLPPRYHGDGRHGRSLVYNDFGQDLLLRLEETGYQVTLFQTDENHPDIKRNVTFVTWKQK